MARQCSMVRVTEEGCLPHRQEQNREETTGLSQTLGKHIPVTKGLSLSSIFEKFPLSSNSDKMRTTSSHYGPLEMVKNSNYSSDFLVCHNSILTIDYVHYVHRKMHSPPLKMLEVSLSISRSGSRISYFNHV